MHDMELPSKYEISITDEAQMQLLGSAIAGLLPLQPTVWLRGELGAGKSTLARACLRALGVSGAVKSPTYTLVERYPLAGGGEAWHLDLYRIADPDELEFLGLDESDVRFWLIEWPEQGGDWVPRGDLELHILHTGSNEREVRLTVRDSRIVTQLANVMARFH